ncbi:MAG TPA: carbon-nitrogen hydrolase family protein [Kofleriaceae bacterium]|nr:carbon-nitrogen hydrolase family protein [Kofleriaceae bacterium]
MRVAAWQYPIEQLASFAGWRAKLAAAAGEAAGAGAAVLVMPEYSAMELTSLLAPGEQATLAAQLAALQRLLPDYLAALVEAARVHRIAIVGGSFPEQLGAGFHNRLRVVAESGDSVVVEKLVMTRFERERWGITGGSAQAVVELGGGLRLGVAICYDAEFPLIARRLAEAGANVLAVPSCTDSLAGYHRVRVACAARALENQCYVVQAPTVGSAPWSIAVDDNLGAAGVFAPCDRGFPDDGVVALGPLNQPHLLVTELELARVDEVRRDGQVLGHRDWAESTSLVGAVTRARLT